MSKMVHNVMGTPYEVLIGERKDIGMSEDHMGECRVYSKKILVCTDLGDCTEEERDVRVRETIAHEIFHAYANEAGLDLSDDQEEMVATFYMKNYKKMYDSILEILDGKGI